MNYDYIGYETITSMHEKEFCVYQIPDVKRITIFQKLGLIDNVDKPVKIEMVRLVVTEHKNPHESENMKPSVIVLKGILTTERVISIKYDRDPIDYYMSNKGDIIIGDDCESVEKEVEQVLRELISYEWNIHNYTYSKSYMRMMEHINAKYIEILKDKKPEMFV